MNNLTYTLDEADSAYEELRELNVQLDADPLAYGPKRLNAKVSEVRRMLERCERLYLDVSQRLHAVKHARRRAETDLDLAKKDLFSNDPHVRAGRSVADREAIATGRLIKEVHLLDDLNSAEEGLLAVLTVIKAKRTDLKDTEGRLRDQIRLCGEELGLGNRWGSKLPFTPDVDLKNAPVINIAPVDDILSGVEGEIHLQQQSGEWTGPGQEEAERAVSALMGTVVESDEEEKSSETEAPKQKYVAPDCGISPGQKFESFPEPETPETLPTDATEIAISEHPEVDLAVALKGSATTSEIDCFFGDPAAIAAAVSAQNKPATVSPLDDAALDSLLSSFEET